jgi:CRISPR-associated protein Csb2
MLTLGVELLLPRAIITRWNNRAMPEWPPHPDRVFMALVAGFGETGQDAAEQAALEWLEALGPPALAIPESVSVRTPFTSYVPVNDTSDPIVKGKVLSPMGSLPIGRVRQPRQFPAVVPETPSFNLIWNVETPAHVRPALEAVCAKATYLGHSTTPVRVWVEDQEIPPNLVPTNGTAPHRLRVFGSGRLHYLRFRFAGGLRPEPSQWQGYAAPQATEPAPVPAPFDAGLLVLRQVGGRKFSLESCSMLADALRAALMKRHHGSLPEWLSGHRADGSPTTLERPAILPLGFAGLPHADGHILGLALAVPAGFSATDMQLLCDLLLMHDDPSQDAEETLAYVRLIVKNPVLQRVVGQCELELEERPLSARPYTLRPDTWTGPASLWATATPLVLPHFPRRALTPEEVVARACRDAGYPDPADVRTSFAPALCGVPHSQSFFVRQRRGGRPPRPLTHAVIRFAKAVTGPLLIGAGRYNGFGFCRPLPEDSAP